MTQVGRIFQTANAVALGGASAITATPMAAMPLLAVDGAGARREITMSTTGGATTRGLTDVLAAPVPYPAPAMFTLGAAGGCVPIAAAEITPAVGQGQPVVRWTYLLHGHGGNMGINLVTAAANPAHVYIAFMFNSANVSLGYAQENESAQYLEALAPGNAIPDQNVLMLYGPHSSLAITGSGLIGVLPGNAAPAAQAKTCRCCFLTTAACTGLGLPDDCLELETLRSHRAVMRGHARGRAILEEYDAIGPGIVHAMARSADPPALYSRIFNGFIAPTATLLRAGRPAEAEALYRRMVERLLRL